MPHLDHFSLIAPFYDRIFSGLASPRLRELLALPAGRLLDVGGGTGRVASGLANEVEEVILCDVARGMLAEARARTGLRAVRGSAEHLPFADGAFERVLVVDALHHFADHPRAARELVRVVAPGGRLVVQDMNIERLPVKLIALGERLLGMGSRFYRPAELGRLFAFAATEGQVSVEAEGPMDLFLVMQKMGRE